MSMTEMKALKKYIEAGVNRNKKLKPNIVRVGDCVKVINPIIFIRCGYPMGVNEAQKDVEEHFGKNIKDLIYSIRNCEKLVQEHSLDAPLITLQETTEDRLYRRVLRELAYARLQMKNYGGKERSLHTEVFEPIRGNTYWVSRITIHKTGTYCKGWSNQTWDGDYDFQPNYLENEKTHKILELYTSKYSALVEKAQEEGKENTVKYEPELSEYIRIEAIHVEKVPDYRDKPKVPKNLW